MKTIGMVSALTSELELIKNSLANVEEITFKGTEFFKGTLGNYEVVLTVCSIGKVNSAVKTQMMIDKFDVDFIINSGIAGSLDSSASHLGVVVGDKVFYHDFDLGLFKRFAPFVESFECDKTMQQAFLSANSQVSDMVVGNIATGDEFVAGKERKEKIKAILNPLCAEMEGASIMHTAYLNSIPGLVIRCISDMADDDADFVYEEFEQVAAHKVAEMVIKTIKTL